MREEPSTKNDFRKALRRKGLGLGATVGGELAT
jgi:hypothetical protein